MPYEYLEETARADIAFHAWGKSLEETFISACDATMNVMIDNLVSIEFKIERALQLSNTELDMLLFDLLQEVIFFKDAEQLLLRVRQLSIKKEGAQWLLSGQAAGEKLDPERHQQRADVKAVTLHNFHLEQTDQGWKASVILDI